MIDHDEVVRAAPGILGSLAAMLWIKDTWPRRITYVLVGGASSYYGAETCAKMLHAEVGLMGFLLGLFGMAIVAKLFEAIDSIDPKRLVDQAFKKLGL